MLFVFVALLVSNPLHAIQRLAEQRSIVFDRIGTEEGLSQAFVTSFVQDSEGYIWIGTQEGLNRYDGFNFDHFYHSFDSSGSLSHDQIRALHLDKKGRLWVGTDSGLNLFNPVSETFTVLEDRVGIHDYAIYTIEEDNTGRIWVGGVGGLYSISETDGEPFLEKQESYLGSVRALSLSKDGHGIWIGGVTAGLSFLSFVDDRVVRFDRDSQGEKILADDHVRAILEDSYGFVWIATFDGGVSRYNYKEDISFTFPISLEDKTRLSSRRARSLLEDRLGDIWVGTEVGLHLWDEHEGFVRFEHDLTNPRSLSENTIHSLYQDNGGVIWVGTFNGINKWNANVGMFPYFSRPANADDIAPSNNITSFVEDSMDNVWVGTFFGLLKWDSQSGGFKTYSPSDIGLNDKRVMSLEARGNDIWIGTMSAGINVLRDGKIISTHEHKPTNSFSVPANGITSFLTDSEQRLWVTTFGGGVAQYEGERRFRRFPGPNHNQDSFPEMRCMDIVEVNQNRFWIATYGGGVVILNPEDGSTEILSTANSEILSDTLLTLLATERGVYIGTESRGLSYYNLETGEITNYTKQDGLVSDAIYGLLKDENGNIWISSAKGLAMFSPRDQTFTSFGTIHGLQGSDFNSGAFHRLRDGSLAFGGINGFNVFFPDQIVGNMHVPQVTLTGFKLFNEVYDLGKPLSEIEEVALKYNDSVFGFTFASMDFTAPSKNSYRYILQGFDKGWVEHIGRREVTYTNLDPGTYTFRVQGSNNDGVWNEEGASIALIVNPAPWQTWWAYTAYSALVVFLFYLVLRYNSDRLQRDAERRYSARLQLYIESLEEASDCILIADSSGTLLFANNTITEGLNKTPSEVIGESLWGVLFENEDDVSRARSQLEANGRYHGEVLLAGSDGSTVTHDVTIAAVQQTSHEERAYVGISRDVTQRKITEAELEDYRKNLERLVEVRTEALQKEIAENKAIQLHLADSLQEKELLIKEVHHRVKNNMQVISSLLSIQAHGAGDEVYSNMLNESQQRIKSMALIHETLYQSKDLLKIDFQEYIESLTTSLSRSYSVPGVSVYVDVNVDHVELDLETAVPCGLVINELVSNSLKHAFHGKEGTAIIDIDFVANDCRYDLRIADNGIGLPANFDLHKNTSMGMEIVSILTTQLEGELSAHSDQGAVFEISFPRVVHG